jgi:hypothetical protein
MGLALSLGPTEATDMGKLNPFPTTKKFEYPHWIVEARRYDDYETARAFAEKKCVDLDRPVTIMQREDRVSPAFALESVAFRGGRVVASPSAKLG